MPFILQPAVEADAPRFVEIERLTYADTPLQPILFPGPFPPDAAKGRAEGMVKQLRGDPTVRWIKVVDNETQEIAAWAIWEIIDEPEKKKSVKSREFGDGCNVEACEELFYGMQAKRAVLVGDKPHCVLGTLQTDPKYQGRGAGSMLIGWGLDVADELHLPVYLESSPVAHSLYQKFGFRDVDQLIMNPKWLHGNADPKIYFMLREAR